jgi:uncharacterized protein
MRIAITGASGLIGSAVGKTLRERGNEIIPVSRTPEPATHAIGWDPQRGFEPADVLSGIDAVIHLAGEPVDGRWTAAKRAKIRDSRVQGTKAVVAAIAAAHPRPRVLISASGIDYYGEAYGDALVDEDSEPGTSFLAEVTRAWEDAACEVEALDGEPVRLCRARIAMVLAAEGGALARMLPAFRMGVGGKLGSGRQWMSWIHLRDVVEALVMMLDHDDMRGPYNLCAPNPVRNAEFTKVLGEVLGRPTFMRVPKLGLRAVLGEMGESLLLGGRRAVPKRLVEEGFVFGFPELRAALEQLLLSR